MAANFGEAKFRRIAIKRRFMLDFDQPPFAGAGLASDSRVKSLVDDIFVGASPTSASQTFLPFVHGKAIDKGLEIQLETSATFLSDVDALGTKAALVALRSGSNVITSTQVGAGQAETFRIVRSSDCREDSLSWILDIDRPLTLEVLVMRRGGLEKELVDISAQLQALRRSPPRTGKCWLIKI